MNIQGKRENHHRLLLALLGLIWGAATSCSAAAHCPIGLGPGALVEWQVTLGPGWMERWFELVDPIQEAGSRSHWRSLFFNEDGRLEMVAEHLCRDGEPVSRLRYFRWPRGEEPRWTRRSDLELPLRLHWVGWKGARHVDAMEWQVLGLGEDPISIRLALLSVTFPEQGEPPSWKVLGAPFQLGPLIGD
ncbi:MAG: hypothetical protein JW797_10995 [Bradymonadales bacterium]|nr:hypothetical protein [Bradymonadales bacterium]